MKDHFWMLESFDTYIRNLEELFDFSTLNFDLKKRDFVSVHMIPQHYFACIDGQNKMDYIGRIENIDEGWKELTKKMNVTSSLRHLNKSKREDAWLDYYTPELLNIVNDLYEKDFETFNYTRI